MVATAAPTNGSRIHTLTLPPPMFVTFRAKLVGTTSLICDGFSEEAKAKIARAQSGAAKVKPGPRDPEGEFEHAAYRRDDGTYGFPKLGFRKALASAAIRMTELKGTEMLASFAIDTPDELLELVDIGDGPKMRTDHIVRQRQGGLAYRAEFWPWSVWLPIKLDPTVVSLEQFVHALYKAGMGVGIGNWRPEKSGDHGTWTVADISEAVEVVLPEVGR